MKDKSSAMMKQEWIGERTMITLVPLELEVTGGTTEEIAVDALLR